MYYWATFRRRGDRSIRLDTRVYLNSQETISDSDPCLGCIIGKNPGSAEPEVPRRASVPMDLSGDRFLPNVRAIVRKAYGQAGITEPRSGYVRVLNLFYLCDRNLPRALMTLHRSPALPRCPTEKQACNWAWFAWGGDDARLNRMKKRFRDFPANACFFFDGEISQVVDGIPQDAQLARHTQGLIHAPVVQHLAKLIAAQAKAR